MRRKSRSLQPVARRVVMASMTVMAASGIGLVAAPMAFGQVALPLGGSLLGGSSQNAGVTNSGSASANSGGNTAVGNASSNSVSVSTPVATVGVPVAVGAPTNTSGGSATVASGAASAVGNSSGTDVGQSNASANQVGGFLAQNAGVTNAGSASANSGGNTAVGNRSTNTQTVTQTVSGGLVGVGVNIGAPTNTSSGSATITSGAANAVGNSSTTDIGQASLQGAGTRLGGVGAGGVVPCGAGRINSQQAAVRNEGQAQANTGNNVATGNASTNNNSTTVSQGVSGGLAGVGLTIGAPTNTSSGTAVITTGPATAVGNTSVTEVGQVQSCPQIQTLAARPGVAVPAPRVGTLARTGLDTSDLGMIAGALVGVGMLLVASQRRRVAARSVAVPMAGFGLGMGGDEWDRAVR